MTRFSHLEQHSISFEHCSMYLVMGRGDQRTHMLNSQKGTKMPCWGPGSKNSLTCSCLSGACSPVLFWWSGHISLHFQFTLHSVLWVYAWSNFTVSLPAALPLFLLLLTMRHTYSLSFFIFHSCPEFKRHINITSSVMAFSFSLFCLAFSTFSLQFSLLHFCPLF